MDAILYMASTGCQWAMLPRDLPPPSTVQRYFYDWRDSGLLRTLDRHLVAKARDLEGREASPSAGIIYSHSVKTTESGGIRGFDAGKKVKGRKRHTVTDTLGLMVGLVVQGAYVQDRDGAPAVLASIRKAFPWLRHVFAPSRRGGPNRGHACVSGDVLRGGNDGFGVQSDRPEGSLESIGISAWEDGVCRPACEACLIGVADIAALRSGEAAYGGAGDETFALGATLAFSESVENLALTAELTDPGLLLLA